MSKPTLTFTHITTATAILNIDGINFLTDPFFGEVGTHETSGDWSKARLKEDFGLDKAPESGSLTITEPPAMKLHDLPPIDAVLLSHEDHLDNLDPVGRQLLDGRRVFTTVDGAKNLQPRPAVVGLKPWQTVTSVIGGKEFRITGTPCKHFPVGEVTGFILETDSFGTHAETGKPNAIYFSGDTVYIDELKKIKDRVHVTAAVLNLGNATFEFPIGPIQITMDGKQAVRLVQDIGADVMVPMHFESWEHFKEHGEDLARIFEEAGIMHKVCWTTPGVEKIVY
ncbi:beta-lactamase superfamily domain-containing protein [Aspergillus avenaceus]|uniref:Beta-lactamase superfamily domain-containing protein n=1 Tax=Aspergillus avenaceus TaxID=36643 RepID=A0A5N6U4T2_ASPAV|nr:beta-lactamase superfamily domain-containing protein [Aspergillus avenaceus]